MVVSYVPNPNWSNLYWLSIIKLMKCGSLRCAGHVIRTQEVIKKIQQGNSYEKETTWKTGDEKTSL